MNWQRRLIQREEYNAKFFERRNPAQNFEAAIWNAGTSLVQHRTVNDLTCLRLWAHTQAAETQERKLSTTALRHGVKRGRCFHCRSVEYLERIDRITD